MNAIETSGLVKKYKNNIVVNRINLEVPEKSIYGFLGPNGAGKTTTIRMLLGLINPTSGRVLIKGKDIKKEKKEILRSIGALVENPSLYYHLTGKENLKIPAKILNCKEKRIGEVLELVNLTNAQNKQVGEYSLGMKQRLGLAIALLHEPEIIILDEPTNGLDPQGIKEMRDLIKSLPEKFGMTVFLSSHMLNEIELVASHVGIINRGELLFQGKLKELEKKQEKRVLIKVNEIKKTEGILKQFHLQTKQEDTSILAVKDLPEIQIPQVLKTLIANNIEVFSIVPQKQSLEDTFMQLTK